MTNLIRNPLTVIGVFAGIAEASGAAALPFLAPEVQAIYVWFLMLFPTFLVTLFFGTLWKKHHVLYAPSDFDDQSMFRDFVSSPNAILDRLEQLIEEVELEPVVVPDKSAEPSEEATSIEPAPSVTAEALLTNFKKQVLEVDAKDRMATTYALAYLSERHRLGIMQQEVTPVVCPNVRFDAVFTKGPTITIVEVMYSRHDRPSEQQIAAASQRFMTYFNAVGSKDRQHVKFQVFVVLETGAENVNARVDIAFRVKARMPRDLSVEVHVHDFATLSGMFKTVNGEIKMKPVEEMTYPQEMAAGYRRSSGPMATSYAERRIREDDERASKSD